MARPPSPARSATARGPAAGAAVAGAPPRLEARRGALVTADGVFQTGALLAGAVILVTLAGIFVMLFLDSRLVLSTFGWSFFTTSVWDNVKHQFGILPYIYGTLMTSAVAVV